MTLKTLLAFAALVPPAMAFAAPATAGEMEIIATPYFLLPTTNGKFGVGRFDETIDDTPADLFDKLNWAVMGSLEVNNGEWGVNLDVNYISLDVTEDDRPLSLNGHQSAYTATVLKRIHPMAWAYAGVRYSDFGIKLECRNPCVLPAPLSTATQSPDRTRSKGWFEPVIGFRAELPFNDKLDLTVIADMGGFGAGSKISANFWPQLGIRMGASSKALIGYRIIYVDYESGSGSTRFVYDAATFGPTIGVEFRF